MTLLQQYDLFEDVAITELRAKVESLEKSQERVRKNLFAKHGDVVKMLLELLVRIEQLEGKKDEYTT